MTFKLPLIVCLLGISISANAQLVFSESFETMTTGDLGSQNNWVPYWANGANSTDVQVADASPLDYPDYNTAGGKYITTAGGDDPYKLFTSPVMTNTDVSFYTAFVVRATSTGSAASTEWSIALRNTANNAYLSRFFIVANNGALRFGISVGQHGGIAAAHAGNFVYGTNYLILLRYDVVAGGADKMYLWVNPSTVAEPLPITANATATDAEANYGSQVNALEVFQGLGNANPPIAAFDQIKVGNDWNSVIPSGGPLPVKFSALTAVQKENGIKVDWSNYTENNISHYEIERSANGQNFKFISSQNPKQNNSSRADYSWTDGKPFEGNNFYRIKSIDIDGKIGYSLIVKITTGKLSAELSIFPIPAKGSQLTLQASKLPEGTYTLNVFDFSGKRMYSERIQHSGGAISKILSLNATLKPGMYNMVLTGGGISLNQKFLAE